MYSGLEQRTTVERNDAVMKTTWFSSRFILTAEAVQCLSMYVFLVQATVFIIWERCFRILHHTPKTDELHTLFSVCTVRILAKLQISWPFLAVIFPIAALWYIVFLIIDITLSQKTATWNKDLEADRAILVSALMIVGKHCRIERFYGLCESNRHLFVYDFLSTWMLGFIYRVSLSKMLLRGCQWLFKPCFTLYGLSMEDLPADPTPVDGTSPSDKWIMLHQRSSRVHFAYMGQNLLIAFANVGLA